MPRDAYKPTAAAHRSAKLLRQKGRQLEATLILLPDHLNPGEREIAKNALCEASAILCDAAERVVNPLPELD